MKTKTLQIFSDSGHAWLKVKRESIPLHILKDVSNYSYQRKDYVYLEEDKDAAIYINFLKDEGIKIKFNTHRSNNSRIRNYLPFHLTVKENLIANKIKIIQKAIKNNERYGKLFSTSEDKENFIFVLKNIVGGLC